MKIDEAIDRLDSLPYENLGFARVDHDRSARKGFPEVIFGIGKSPDQVAAIAVSILERSQRLLITKTSQEAFRAVSKRIPEAFYNKTAQTITVDRRTNQVKSPGIVVVSAGTSDEQIAQEAVVTANLMDCEVECFNDVGVAGIHRLFSVLPMLEKARVIIVVAGMDGALPSVVGGLVKAPIIAVPTGIGYGTSFEGIAPLLAMLNTCSPGITVVNINNGFGAGYFAALVLNKN